MTGRQLATGPGPVFHYDGLTEGGLQPGSDRARHDVGAAPRRIGHDDRDRLAIGDHAFRMRADPGGGQRGACGRDELATRQSDADGLERHVHSFR